jgi:hypothetical protein
MMFRQNLSLKLEGLSTLQRKLLIELMQKSYPQYWSMFRKPINWTFQKENLEKFIHNHYGEFARELARAGLASDFSTIRRVRHAH